ncbi:hypothetical protein GLAREA_03716 [Glarea lozoyensis ATCC 20868]|uniref:Acetylserotonin methytransferase-like protein n=1 Tax=Glarea lozoyensis (strain ATCC 20868 / MF5171) TaxID=1116229 RepID=S3D0S2_GLAL2|nr:uncharacterized protein GLAREA_03716 [Glarea lozoyensis ATCC 20868]EPE30749.1 hypothetical protein GLAREA_03716 [Glarea lozoyensis ATCC 20868]
MATGESSTGGGGQSPGGLQLFPPPPKKAKKPGRKPSTRRNAIEPQAPPQSAIERPQSVSYPSSGRGSSLALRSTPQEASTSSPIVQPSQAHIAADIPRSHTSFSEAPTLVRSNSTQSHSSMRKTGLHESPPRGEEPVMRSIFPRYNPELALEYQNYFPSQPSPSHIPKTVINRRPYSPSIYADQRSPGIGGGLQSPLSIGSAAGCFPQHLQDESILEPSTSEELKELWKVANGWRVSASEGRAFCLKMISLPEEPVHILSSATSTPFYTLKVIPTSTSAQVSMTRQDPNRPATTSSPRLRSKEKDKDTDVLNTTLEEAVRRLPPNDGLVALLYPRAASNMALDMAAKPHRADGPSIIAAAEREAGRLVWDQDSQKYYLVHPALQTPFVIAITSSPAWSRVEYTLEHPELPRNLVKLTRDGAGSGYLEVDTSAAARIDAFYIVDVAICAVMLVSTEEEKKNHVEHFSAPPPSVAPLSPPGTPRSPSSRSILGRKKTAAKREMKMETFELDLEDQSQDSLKGFKAPSKSKEEKTPGCCGLLWMLIKFFWWVVSLFFKIPWRVASWMCGQRKKNKKNAKESKSTLPLPVTS